jgi:hypothetical protein
MRLDFSDLKYMIDAMRTRRRKRDETETTEPRFRRRRHETPRGNEVLNFFEAVQLMNKLVDEAKEKEKKEKEATKKPPPKKEVDALGMTMFFMVISILSGFGISLYLALTFMETAVKLAK